MLQLLLSKVPAVIAGNAQTVEMCLNAVVEFRKILEGMVWRLDGVVTSEPEECSVFAVDVQDAGDDAIA
jgi:hypothetical protein